MGVMNFLTETPDALHATVGDIRNDGPVVGFLDGTKRLWGRIKTNMRSIGKDMR